MIDTVAGGGSLDGLPAGQAPFAQSTARAVGPDGSIYLVVDYSIILRIGPDGVVHTFAGTGASGFSGDGGPATSARLWSPLGIAVDSHGNVFFTDLYRIRRVSSGGVISTVAGTGAPPGSIVNGPALSTAISPSYLALDSAGNIYFSEVSQFCVLRLGADGMISLVAGVSGSSAGEGNSGEGGPATLASINPSFVAIDSGGNLIIVDDNLLRQVTSDGIIHTIAGNYPGSGLPGVYSVSDGSSATNVDFYYLTGLAVAPSGDFYISGEIDGFPSTGIWRVTAKGLIYNVTAESTASVFGADSASNPYFQLENDWIYRATPAGAPTLLAGQGTWTSPDGVAAKGAVLNFPFKAGIAVDASGRILFPDAGMCRIRAINSDGTLATVAGTGQCATTATSGPALSTNLCTPTGVAASASGSFFVSCSDSTAVRVDSGTTAVALPVFLNSHCQQIAADSKNNYYCMQTEAVEKVSADGSTSFITMGFISFFPDAIFVGADDTLYVLVSPPGSFQQFVEEWNGTALAPIENGAIQVTYPNSLAVDSSGVVYIASQFLSRENGGVASTIGLSSFGVFSGDGGPAQSARIGQTCGIALDNKGNVYFVDYTAQRIRRLSGALPSVAPAISGIANSASFAGGSFAYGELVSIFGSNLSPVTGVQSPDDIMFDPVLVNTRVLVDGEPVPILAVSPGQVNAVLNDVNAVASAQVVIEVDGVPSAPATIAITNTAFGLFTANGSGSGTGSIVNQDGSINSGTNPAPKGTTVSLYGTGGGLLNPQSYGGYIEVAAPFGAISANVTATVGGASATVQYAGGAPFLVEGVDQVNVTIPGGTPSGAADLVVNIGSQASNKVTVWVR